MPGHVAEAKRAFALQGRTVDDEEAIRSYLWAARALPVALDALLDQGASVPLADARLVDVRVQSVAPLPSGPVAGVAVHEDGSLVVEVRVVAAAALQDASDPTDPPPSLIVRFGLALQEGSAVHIQRFVVGRS